MHRFRSTASPVKGLTADILVIPLFQITLKDMLKRTFQIKVAEIAYGRPTAYERYATEQLHRIQDILQVVSE